MHVSDKRRGLGRGLGALIPAGPGKGEGAPSGPSPVDVLIPGREKAPDAGADGAGVTDGAAAADGAGATGAADATAPVRPAGDGRRRVVRRGPAGRDHAQPAPAAHGLRRGGARRAGALAARGRPAAARRGAPARRGPVRADHGGAAVARRPGGRVHDDPGHRPRHRRRRPAARRPAGEPAPVPAQPAGGGRGLRPAPAGLRVHPRRAGGPHRPVPPADLQHPAAAQAAAVGAAPSGRRRPVRGSRPRRPWASTTPRPRSGWPRGSSPRDSRCAASRRSSPSAATRRPSGPAARPKRPVAPKLAVLADRLADRFETRVKVDLGRNKGRIVVEFASLDDLERIVGLMSPDTEIPADVLPAEGAPTPPTEALGDLRDSGTPE